MRGFLENKIIFKMRTRRSVVKIILTIRKSFCNARKMRGEGEHTHRRKKI